jgi:chitin disaccharide deacetylase
VPLLINADDFGLTPGVNRSVIELHRAGVLSSATLMATGAFFDDAVSLSRATPTLEVGCHVVLVDGVPALPAAQIPSLCPNGQSFRPALGRFTADLHLGRISAADIEAEATAQIRRLQQAGLRVSHVDTHKHTHLFPRVLRPLLRAARACSVPAIRNPFEPAWAVQATPEASAVRRVQVALLGIHRPAFRRLVREAGLATTAGTLGVLATGTADISGALRHLLAALPAGSETWELVCHPAYPDEHLDRVRTRLRASRAQEHAALLDQITGIPLTTWHSLAGTPSAPFA